VGGISTLADTLVSDLQQWVDLSYVPTARARPPRESGRISLPNVVGAISQYICFLNALWRFRPDIIYLHTSQGLGWLKDTFFILTGRALGCHIVLHVHAADYDALYGRRGRVLQRYIRGVMGLADAVIAVSEEWRERLGQIISVDRVLTFRNCVAVDTFCSRPHQRYPNGVNALFLGSVGPWKGAFELLKAMASLRQRGCPLHLWVCGYEEREGDLDRARVLIQEMQLEDTCQLLGTVGGEEKAELLSTANLLVLPSHHEGLPMVIVEAMAAGLPIVATPVGGIPEVVRDGYNGFLVPVGEVEALAEKLAVLAGDPNLRELMGQRSREIAEQELDVKPYVERLVALYESVAGA